MMYYERKFGSLNKRELLLRFFVPLYFCEWSGEAGFKPSLRSLLSLRQWLKTIKARSSWRLRFARCSHASHRCWCPCGVMIDGGIALAGFTLCWWYSRYTGPIPCPCDEALERLENEEEASVPA